MVLSLKVKFLNPIQRVLPLSASTFVRFAHSPLFVSGAVVPTSATSDADAEDAKDRPTCRKEQDKDKKASRTWEVGVLLQIAKEKG